MMSLSFQKKRQFVLSKTVEELEEKHDFKVPLALFALIKNFLKGIFLFDESLKDKNWKILDFPKTKIQNSWNKLVSS